MNWKNEAVQDLKKLVHRQTAVEILTAELEELNSRLYAVRGPGVDRSPVQGGGCRVEDRVLSLLDERARKRQSLQMAKREAASTCKALAALTDQQRDILDRFFIHRTAGYLQDLAQRYHVEQAQLYRLKDEALRAFTLARYGIVES